LVSAVLGVFTDDQGDFDLWNVFDSFNPEWQFPVYNDYYEEFIDESASESKPEHFSLRCVDEEPFDGKFFSIE
jgi:hypothetical protein